ncbi:DNA replication terminus site-binding protein [Halomonas sabkhae]|uniref:DNA replication terminus site-binding protein n=1 Tax=Halomonas sabkhae TaxID=626223 RepID=UPI0025B31907|nr:DNA replication terminus site-binding protein [Halomonas sabkhae]MDN3526357.1 DNA replication terminus site-binding protein [Halomonas sabkhae]
MMQAPEYRLLAELEAAFDQLVERTHCLVDAWQQSGAAAWSFDTPHADADWLKRALLDYWYEDGQDGRSTRRYVGIVAASDGVMARLQEVNVAKRHLGDLIAEIRREVPGLIPEIKAVLPFRQPALHEHLSGAGLARLHLKQCWRAIPAADAEVTRVRLAWYSSGRSIKRISVYDAQRMLLELDTEAPHVRLQLEKLGGLPDSEPLAQVQQQAALMRANLFFKEPLADGHDRKAMNIALPLFIPSASGQLPDINQPPATPPVQRTRARRSDARLEDTALLPSIRVYRYCDTR